MEKDKKRKDLTAGQLREKISHLPDDHPVCFCENGAGGGVFYFDGMRSFNDAAIVYLERVKR